MPAQDHVVRCVIPDGSPLDPWFVNWSLWQAGENPEPEKRANTCCVWHSFIWRAQHRSLAAVATFPGIW